MEKTVLSGICNELYRSMSNIYAELVEVHPPTLCQFSKYFQYLKINSIDFYLKAHPIPLNIFDGHLFRMDWLLTLATANVFQLND